MIRRFSRYCRMETFKIKPVPVQYNWLCWFALNVAKIKRLVIILAVEFGTMVELTKFCYRQLTVFEIQRQKINVNVVNNPKQSTKLTSVVIHPMMLTMVPRIHHASLNKVLKKIKHCIESIYIPMWLRPYDYSSHVRDILDYIRW